MKLPKILPTSYLNYYTGEILDYIGDGINTSSNEKIVIVRNEKELYFSMLKSTFMLTAIEDASAYNKNLKEIAFKLKQKSIIEPDIVFVFGEGFDLESKEHLVFYVDSHCQFYATPSTIFLETIKSHSKEMNANNKKNDFN